nr:GNAT family protein [uncultured Schaedlerella sp.]
MIADKRNDNLIGFISLGGMNRYDGYMEMEYAVAARYRNKGCAMQAVKKMLEYGFKEMNLSAIAAWVRSHNKASIIVLEKCSFTLEGRLRKHARDQSDTLCYSILREEWERLSRSCIDIRIMNYDDILPICRADGDESRKNINYLKRQLDNQKKGECTALLALYSGAVAGYVFLYHKCRWDGRMHIRAGIQAVHCRRQFKMTA